MTVDGFSLATRLALAVLITCLKPNVTRAEAIRLFKGGARTLRRGPLRGVLDFYVPYRLYRVEVENGGKTATKLLAIDAVTADLDLYHFDCPPAQNECAPCLADRVAPLLISETRACAILTEKVRREVYLKGFFRVRQLEVRARFAQDLRVPYWVGFYGHTDRVNIEVVDAIRRSFEGAKLREIVRTWFRQPASRATRP